MSTSENIKKMTQTFVENKTQNNLKNMPLERIAQDWKTAKQESDGETRKKLNGIVNEEFLQSKIANYVSDLNYDRFSPADFDAVLEFCSDFGYKIKNSNLKKEIESLQEKMESKRLQMPNPITAKLDEESKRIPIKNLDAVNISGNSEIIQNLANPKQPAGKTITFLDDKEKNIGSVEFDKDNNAVIQYVDAEGKINKYTMTADKKFYKTDENNQQVELDISQPKSLSTKEIRAINMGKAAGLMWRKYINKELDKQIQKPTTKVNEGGLQARGNNTVVNEGEDLTEKPQTTRFDEGQSTDNNVGDFKNDTANEIGEKPDELYWKEDDIIKVMFQDWFLAFANSATNWTIHQAEYAVAGIWNTVRDSFNKEDDSSANKKDDTPDKTHQFYSGIEDISQKHMKNMQDASDINAVTDKVRNHDVQNAVLENNLLRDFAQHSGVDVSSMLANGDPEKTVPLIMNCAATYEKFVDGYARASILDGKMQSHSNYIGCDKEDLYERKRLEADKIIKAKLYNQYKDNPQDMNFESFIKTLTTSAQDMDKALECGLKDYNKGRYDELNKKPKENKILKEYQSFKEQNAPQNLFEFAQNQSAILRNRDYITAGLNTEEQALNAAEENNRQKREKLNASKNYILGGLTQNQEKPLKSIIPQQVPYQPQGRE